MSKRRYKMADHTVGTGVQHPRYEPTQMNDAATTDGITIKIEPTDVIDSDVSQDANVTVKHEEHLQLLGNHKIDISIDVKSEPVDVDDVRSLGAAGSAGPADVPRSPVVAATANQEMGIRHKMADHTVGTRVQHPRYEPTQFQAFGAAVAEGVTIKIEPMEVLDCDIADTNVAVKNEEDLKFACFYEVDVTTEVKIEPADAEDAGTPDAAKREVEMPYAMRPCKPEGVQEPFIGTYYETEARKVSKDNQQHTDTKQGSADEPHFSQSKRMFHLSGDLGDWPHKCDICSKSFKWKSNLKLHMVMHTAERKYECHLCCRTFKRKYDLNVHMVTHSGERNHECDICGKGFKRERSLKLHFITHMNERKYQCELCCKNFRTKNCIKQHMMTHMGLRKFECDVCSKSFKSKNNLKHHKVTHITDRKYECEVCHNSFKTNSHLRRHIQTHMPVKRYQCDVCCKSFARNSDLKIHRLTHTDNKPHKCGQCCKSFLTKAYITQHMFSHSFERKYECDDCSKTFKRKNDLKQHLVVHAVSE